MKKIFPNKIWQFFVTVLICIILLSHLVLLEKKLGADKFSNLIFLIFTGAVLLVLNIINKKRQTKIYTIYTPKLDKYFWVIVGITVLATLLVISSFNTFLYLNILKSPYKNNLPSIPMILGGLFLGPILEELIFRKYLLSGLLETYRPKVAIGITALIFALLHIQPIQLFGALLLGWIFGYFFYKTRNITNTILLHFFSNLATFLLTYATYFEPKVLFFRENYYIPIFILSSILLILAFRYLKNIKSATTLDTEGLK